MPTVRVELTWEGDDELVAAQQVADALESDRPDDVWVDDQPADGLFTVLVRFDVDDADPDPVATVDTVLEQAGLEPELVEAEDLAPDD